MTLVHDETTTSVEPPHPPARCEPVAPARSKRWHPVVSWMVVSPWAVLACCLVCFVLGVRSIAGSSFSEYGLLAGASPLYPASIVLAAVAFGLALRQGNTTATVGAIVAMIVCQRLPRAISTDAPIYSWTYKHLGVVDHIQQSGSLAHGVDVYNGWPALFAVTAWVADLTGLSPIDIAHWFTPVYHLFLAGIVYAGARAWRLTRDEGLAATFLVVTLNWVEQDYFAPQAIGMLLAVAMLVPIGLSRDRAVGTAPIMILFGALAITHQLTPYWVLGAACLLVLGRMLKPWWIALVMGAILGVVLLYNGDVLSGHTLFSGDVANNAATRGGGHHGMAGQVFSSAVMRVVTIATWASTVAVLILRWRRGQPVRALAVIALSPILILGGQSYGGEAVFRVFLYSLPGCAFVLAPGLLAGVRAGRIRFAETFAALGVATALAAQAGSANWYTNLIGRDQVTSAGEVLAGSVFPAYVTPLVPGWPERPTGDYVRFAEFTHAFDNALMFQPGLAGRAFDSESDYREFMAVITGRNRPTFVVLSEPMRGFGAFFGLFPAEAIDNLNRRMTSDPRWEVVDEKPGTWVFLYRNDTR